MSTRDPKRAGFTLVEMMVAVTAGAIAITSIYYVSAASSRHFHEQQRIAHTQQSLRMAMEHLRRDISRAGYLGTPNSAQENTCFPPAAAVQAVQMTNGGSTAALTLAGTNSATADTLTMDGNYVTSDEYLIREWDGNSGKIQSEWQSNQRSFGAPFSATAFTETFAAGRILRIENTDGQRFFGQITGTAPATQTITIAQNLPTVGTCSVGRQATAAPISRIRYSVLNVATTGSLASLRSAGSPLAGVNGPALVRQEINIVTGVAIAGTERVIAEHVAEFDVDFTVDNQTVATGIPIYATVNDVAAQNALTANAHRARSAIVRLSIRQAAEDPRFPWVARTVGPPLGPLLRYELTAAAVGAARVRTLTSEIHLTNVAERLLR